VNLAKRNRTNGHATPENIHDEIRIVGSGNALVIDGGNAVRGAVVIYGRGGRRIYCY